MDLSGKGFKIEIDTTTNVISFEFNDGITSVIGSITPSVTMSDGTLRHFALVLDRTNGIRMYFNGSDSTAVIPVGALGDITNTAPIIVGGSGIIANNFLGAMDSFRVALNAAYDVSGATIVVPITGFIEYQEEQLDEYQTDVRIVDEGDLDKILIQRILNLMRPVSERINVIFIRFFDDFIDGIGRFEILQGNASSTVNNQMQLEPSTIVRTIVSDDDDFRDIVLQVKANDTLAVGGVFSVLFFVQDINNYYEYRIDTANKRTSIWKIVAGVPTQIGTYVAADLVPKVSYILTITTSYNDVANNTFIKAHVDSNVTHEFVDASFNKGKFGMKTDAATTMQIDEVEMLQLPVDVRRIEPGFNL